MGLLELTKDLSNFKYTDYSQVGTAYDFMGNDHANGFTNNMAFPNTQFVGIDGSKTIFDSNNTITLGGKDIGIPQSNIPSPFSIKDITGLISQNTNVSKKEIYNYCLKLKNEK